MKPALLLIDLQNGFLAGPDLEPPPGALVDSVARLLGACRLRGLPVLHVHTTVHRDPDDRMPHWKLLGRWQCVEGTPGHEPPVRLRPIEGEFVAHKTAFNAFEDPQLANTLNRLGSDTVILAGVHLHACVREAGLECLRRGLTVMVADDACGSNDPVHAAATRRWLADRAVRFESVARILSWLETGEWSAIVHRSPRCTAEVLFEVSPPTITGIDAAARAAQEGQRARLKLDPARRAEMLLRVADRVEAASDDLARQMAIELGKPVRHGREECRRAAMNVRDVVQRAAAAAVPPLNPVRRRPLGVVGVVTAWNNPVAISLGKLSAALAWGNAALWKPAPPATRIAERLMLDFAAAGIPSEAVILVTGDHAAARLLANNPAIDALTLTGSERAGHALQEICARRHIPFQAELNGNNAAIVWGDADLPAAAAQIAWGGFGFAGQRCTANRRVIVDTSCASRFLELLAAATAALAWGDPLDDAVEIGPLLSETRRDEVAAAIRRAQADGVISRRLTPHQRGDVQPDWARSGAYLAPTILCCSDPQHEIVQEETMGPVVVVQTAAGFDEAIALCNDVRQGLAAALFSQSRALQSRFIDEARAGILKLNSTTAGVDPTLPFGGWKASGVGPPEHGEGDAMFYTRLQAVYESPT